MRYFFLMLFLGNSLCAMEGQPDPFLVSIVQGDVERVKEMIERGSDLRSYQHGEPLFATVYLEDAGKRPEIFRLLLDRGIALDTPLCESHRAGKTVLGSSVLKGRLKDVLYLLAHRADPNKGDKYDERPLMDAVRRYLSKDASGKEVARDDALAIIKALLIKGADPSWQNVFGKTVHDIMPDDSELAGMMQDLEAYKENNPEQFIALWEDFDDLERMPQLKRQFQRHGRFSVLHGIPLSRAVVAPSQSPSLKNGGVKRNRWERDQEE